MDDLARKRRQLIVQAAGIAAILGAYMMFISRKVRKQTPMLTIGRRIDMDVARESNLRYIYHSSDINCLNQLRMKRAPFFRLCNLFRERELLKDSIHTPIEEQVAMFLLVVGHNTRFRALQPTFRRSIEVISRYFKAVLYAVGELRAEMIRPPSNHIHRKIEENNRFNPYFKDCIGAIDGTHVMARVPAAISAAFRGRKDGTTQNVMAAVDFDLKFTYILAGWEGSAHDALILADAVERDDGLSLPPGKFYLVDAGYAVRPGFRKWKTRWQKIDKLRTLSGALWDEESKMIVLADQHYLEHVQDHNKDAEFLNTPLVNYEYMEACFADKLATGKFAMGSNEPLGKPIQVERPGNPIDLESGATQGEGFGEAQASFGIGGEGMDATTPSPSSCPNNKRKRASILSDEDSTQVSNMSDALRVVADAINNTCHSETHPLLCKTIMDLPEFDMDQKLAVLDYLTEHKGKGLNFMKMKDDVRVAAFRRIIAKNPDIV